MAENPTPTPGKIKRDVGTGDQLPYGEATQANQELAFGNAVEQQIADQSLIKPTGPGDLTTPETPPAPVQYATGPEQRYSPANGMEEVLFGPATGVKPTFDDGSGPVPQHVIRALPVLSAIVQDPTTPAAIKAAFSFVVQRLAHEMDQRY